MTLKAPLGLSAIALREMMLRGESSVLEVTEAHLAHIARRNPTLNAFQRVDADRALTRAQELDEARSRGEATGALFGVPIALKANMCVRGLETNCGSRMLAGYTAPYTASFVQKLIDAGAVLIGVTEMDEFAMGSSGENSAFTCPRNPWDLQRTAGGSSSGAAVSVASRMTPIALGSDTGGSVRQPAAFCGVYGLKPTYGRISRYGLVAFGSSLDQVSPFAHCSRDLELLLEVLSGNDPLDSTSLPLPPFEAEPTSEVQRLVGFKIGVLKHDLATDVAPEVNTRCAAQLERFRAMGAELVDITLPNLAYAIPTYYVVATAEASSNLGRYDGSLFGNRIDGDGSLVGMFEATRNGLFGEEVKRRILLGTYVLSAGYYDAWYGKAQRVRTLLRRDYAAAFEQVDVVASPTSPSTAFPLGAKKEDALAMYLSDLFTVPASLAGLPAISLPAGLSEDAKPLPVGLQLVGPALSEGRLLRLAASLEMDANGPHPLPPMGEESR